ncbi:hypothetical protein [Massilibacteroides vaginae]|uniref:hypothetical protein n=1 Tax=Massilibacteroides vaginae TaxID=1673718 RepID=UPI000A1C7D69|nr:hypothetical protein [Massilibacteroides vaginae]
MYYSAGKPERPFLSSKQTIKRKQKSKFSLIFNLKTRKNSPEKQLLQTTVYQQHRKAKNIKDIFLNIKDIFGKIKDIIKNIKDTIFKRIPQADQIEMLK